MSRQYDTHLRGVEAQFGAERAELTAELLRLREQVSKAPDDGKLAELQVRCMVLCAVCCLSMLETGDGLGACTVACPATCCALLCSINSIKRP